MSSRTLEFSREPVDNHQLASLCGPLEDNLRRAYPARATPGEEVELELPPRLLDQRG